MKEGPARQLPVGTPVTVRACDQAVALGQAFPGDPRVGSWAVATPRPGGRRRRRRPAAMKRVLVTGMSGTGKSSVMAVLAARGYPAVDLDDAWCEPLPDGRRRWREDAVRALLDAEEADVLFVSGCEENQGVFRSRFDHVVLLSAPVPVLLQRLASRTGNPYGSTEEDRRRVLADVAEVEPLLRRSADHEIVTTVPLEEVVARLLRAVGVATG